MINAQPHIQHVNRSPFPGQKASEYEADHSTPNRNEVKFCGAIPPLPICIQDKHRNNSVSTMMPVNLLKTKRRLLNLKTQSIPRSKHSISIIKINQFMLYGEEVAVCSQINTKHINAVWAECTIVEC
jgi:hypothetical protein